MASKSEDAAETEERIARLEHALAREQAKTRALSDISAALGSTLDLDELLALVASKITEVIDADRSTIYLLDDDGQHLVSRVAEGQGSSEIRLKVGEGLAGWVARTGEKLNIRDAYQDVRFDAEWDRRTGYRTRSTLCVPMKNRHGRTLGVVQVLNKAEGHFTADDEALLTALATQAGVSIENGKLFISVINKNMELLDIKEQLERRVRELDVLFEIAQVSASASELDEMLEGVLARAVRAIEAEAGAILMAEPSGDLRFRSAVGGHPDVVKRQTIRRGDGISGWVARHGRAQVVNDVEADDRHAKEVADRVGYHPRSVLAVPLSWEEGSGALELLNKHGGQTPFTDEDVRTASLIANHISTAIGLAEARARKGKRDRLSTIGQLLSSVLHDLKTPMTIISGYVQLLVKEDDGDERARLAQSVLRQVELINAMTRETIAFARGDRSVWVRKVYLHKFFAELKEQLERELEGRGIEIALDLRDRGVARFDQHKIQRAVHNLARNAAEALGEEGGRFDMIVERRGEDDALVLRFRDDGPGVPDEIRYALFDSFTTHGKQGGTGLGLAIVRKIVDDHDGTITVDSRPGQTEFRIVLPQHAGESGVHPAVA
ncbi:MAG TPA: GAF domain-containing sensor histidine kinase [Sandaracinaceae bacterium LLY-WYZ-13_1]|nr:GAF domain-containing sensor histidine kinase [Sandaracinaceae bacterium LLY-WYZ-13_1]